MDTDDHTAALIAIGTVRLWCRSGLARKIREAAGLTLDECGRLAGTTAQSVFRWEQNQRKPQGAHAVRYHRALVQAQELTAAANDLAVTA